MVKHVYNATGKSLWPHELEELPCDLLDAILALEVDVPKKKKNIKKIQDQAKEHGK